MDLRRYELAMLAAARAIRSSYCSLAHGSFLAERFGLDIPAVVADAAAAGLDEADIAVMDLAAKVATDAASVTAEDRQRLVDLGVPALEAEGVILAAAARCFFSKSLDGLGAAPDASYRDLPADMRGVLEVGRPIAEA